VIGDEPINPKEVRSTYLGALDRFVVSLIAGFGEEEGIQTPEEALSAAVRLTQDEDSRGTQWYVHDRQTGITQMFEQGMADGRMSLDDFEAIIE
jgi:hypothetical protein